MANSVDPDQTPRAAASDLGLHCLQRSICSNTYGYYGSILYRFGSCLFYLSLICGFCAVCLGLLFLLLSLVGYVL